MNVFSFDSQDQDGELFGEAISRALWSRPANVGWMACCSTALRATSLTNRSSHLDSDKKAPLTLSLSAPPPFSLAVQQLVIHDLVLGGPRRFHDSSIGSVGPGKGNTYPAHGGKIM
jgi:hypothetical protein